jgi:hypothetical protein
MSPTSHEHCYDDPRYACNHHLQPLRPKMCVEIIYFFLGAALSTSWIVRPKRCIIVNAAKAMGGKAYLVVGSASTSPLFLGRPVKVCKGIVSTGP